MADPKPGIDLTSEPDFEKMSDQDLDIYLGALREENKKRVAQVVALGGDPLRKPRKPKAEKEKKPSVEEEVIDVD